MTDQTLPNNDPNLQLARRVGNYLEGQSNLDEVEDPLIHVLADYKEQRSKKFDSAFDYDSQTLWDNISKKTRPQENSTRIHKPGKSKSFSKVIWATAASFLIAAFIGIYYYTAQQPDLIASSSQTIETVALADGSTATLRPHSSIYVLPGNSNEHNYKLEGEAYFEVIPNAERTFSVQAGNGKVNVLGTKFDLSNWGNQIQVFLEEGSISFENMNTNDSVILSPGESAEIEPDNTLNSGIADRSEFTDWMNRELIFKNKTARYVFHEIEQEFNFIISAPDSIMNTKLSGELSLQDAQQSLEDLSLVLDGQFENEDEDKGDNRFKFVPNQ